MLLAVQTEDQNAVPLNVTCWPSISPAEAVVSLDYDLAVDFDLQNVVIAIPCPQHPRINQACSAKNVVSAKLLSK